MDNEFFTPNVSPKKQKEMQDLQAQATLDWLDGYRAGHIQGHADGYEEGINAGWLRGRDDIIYQLKRLTQNNFDPELESLVKEIIGEY